jgi:Zn-dependent M28 family amino/carboxypeptidase
MSWATGKLTEAGLEHVHAEPFPMTAWLRGTETAQILAPAKQPLAVTALGGSVATDAAGIEADIALFRTYADLLAAPPGSLTGKIAVVTQRMVRAEDGGGYRAANPIRRRGPSEAAKRGAVAYLLRSLGTDNHRLPHTGALNYDDKVARIPAAALSNPDADQLERLTAHGPVRLKLVLTPSERENAEAWNVVGEVTGRDKPDEIVLIGAHLDSWDLGTGATDDGAGIAIVTAAGKFIAALPQHPRRTLRIVLFGAEEMNYSGPAYAQAHHDDAGHIALAAEADFGARRVYGVQLPASVLKADFARSLADVLAPGGAFIDTRPALGSGDDVAGLQELGVPVASLRQNGFDYFDTHHTADDTLDKIDPAELAQAAAAWAAFAYLAADCEVDFRPTQPAGKGAE